RQDQSFGGRLHMGDGEHDATLGPRRASSADGRDQRITPNKRRTLAAAPWERFSTPEPDNGAHLWLAEPSVARDPQPAAEQDGPPVGPPVEKEAAPAPAAPTSTRRVASHTSGALSVADLLAKVGATMPDRPSHHGVAPDDEPDEAPPEDPRNDLLDTQVIDIPAYSLDLASEIPDLG